MIFAPGDVRPGRILPGGNSSRGKFLPGEIPETGQIEPGPDAAAQCAHDPYSTAKQKRHLKYLD